MCQSQFYKPNAYVTIPDVYSLEAKDLWHKLLVHIIIDYFAKTLTDLTWPTNCNLTIDIIGFPV